MKKSIFLGLMLLLMMSFTYFDYKIKRVEIECVGCEVITNPCKKCPPETYFYNPSFVRLTINGNQEQPFEFKSGKVSKGYVFMSGEDLNGNSVSKTFPISKLRDAEGLPMDEEAAIEYLKDFTCIGGEFDASFVVNAGTTADASDDSLGSSTITPGDTLHLWSPGGTSNFTVTPGSAIIGIDGFSLPDYNNVNDSTLTKLSNGANDTLAFYSGGAGITFGEIPSASVFKRTVVGDNDSLYIVRGIMDTQGLFGSNDYDSWFSGDFVQYKDQDAGLFIQNNSNKAGILQQVTSTDIATGDKHDSRLIIETGVITLSHTPADNFSTLVSVHDSTLTLQVEGQSYTWPRSLGAVGDQLTLGSGFAGELNWSPGKPEGHGGLLYDNITGGGDPLSGGTLQAIAAQDTWEKFTAFNTAAPLLNVSAKLAPATADSLSVEEAGTYHLFISISFDGTSTDEIFIRANATNNGPILGSLAGRSSSSGTNVGSISSNTIVELLADEGVWVDIYNSTSDGDLTVLSSVLMLHRIN